MSEKPYSSDEILAKIDELPTLPSIVYELNQIINDPLSAAADVEEVMLNDPALTSRVLKLVNSAYYAIPGGVSNLKRAIVYLGFDTVQQLVLTSSILDTVGSAGSKGLDLPKFWQHSMGVAMASEVIAVQLKHKSPADLFTAGLLHDLGKVALQMIDPRTLEKAISHAAEKSLSLDEAEKDLGTIPHAELGKLLTEKWRLPRKIQVVAQYHHETDPAGRQGISAELHEMIDMVTLGNLLIHALKFGDSGHRKVLGAPKTLLARLNIETSQMKTFSDKIREALSRADMILRIMGGG